MKKREPLMVVLLAIITFGIYGFYWIYATRSEMVKKGAKIPPFWLLLLPVLLIFAAFINLIVSQADNDSIIGITNVALVLMGVAGLFGVPYYLYFMYKFCGGAQKVTRRRLDQMSCFLLFIVLAIVSSSLSTGRDGVALLGGALSALWFGYMQHGFNKYVRS